MVSGSSKFRPYTTKDEILAKHKTVVNGFLSGKTRDLQYRKQQLRNLYYAVRDNETLLKDALFQDIHRNPDDTEFMEIHNILSDITLAISKLDSWAADEPLPLDIRFAAAHPVLRKDPYGSVLIFGPWNYPYLCTVLPVVSAIAAGNTVVLKPSEMVPHSTEALIEVLEGALDPDIFQIVLGAVPESTVALDLKWDRIMLTGSCNVGKIVATAAAKHLTPVTLELGGKSPAFVTRNADLATAATRIVWGKFANSGQTCVAPDYAVVDEDVKDKFVAELKKATKKFYPNLTKETRTYTHIVNERLWERMDTLVKATKGKIELAWGEPDRATRFYPPTIVSGVDINDSLMKEELFGPVLPILTMKDVVKEGAAFVHNHDHPLALYVFTNKQAEADILLNETRSGSAVVNDVLVQSGSSAIPFGGVGNSGVGRYHGKSGFDEFTNNRTVLRQPIFMEPLLQGRYPHNIRSAVRRLRWLAVPYAWFSRSGAVNRPFYYKILSRWWVLVLAVVVVAARL